MQLLNCWEPVFLMVLSLPMCVYVKGVDFEKLLDAGLFISEALKRPSCSKVAQARGKSRHWLQGCRLSEASLCGSVYIRSSQTTVMFRSGTSPRKTSTLINDVVDSTSFTWKAVELSILFSIFSVNSEFFCADVSCVRSYVRSFTSRYGVVRWWCHFCDFGKCDF